MSAGNRPVTFRASPSLIALLDARARRDKVTRTDVILDVITRALVGGQEPK